MTREQYYRRWVWLGPIGVFVIGAGVAAGSSHLKWPSVVLASLGLLVLVVDMINIVRAE